MASNPPLLTDTDNVSSITKWGMLKVDCEIYNIYNIVIDSSFCWA